MGPPSSVYACRGTNCHECEAMAYADVDYALSVNKEF
jgi:hypothetical protein